MPLHIRAQCLILLRRHILLIEGVQLLVILGSQDIGKMMFTAINGVLGIVENTTQGLLARTARVAADGFEFQVLNASCHSEQEVRNKSTNWFFHYCNCFRFIIDCLLFVFHNFAHSNPPTHSLEQAWREHPSAAALMQDD